MREWIFYIDVYNKKNSYTNTEGEEKFSLRRIIEIIEKYSKEWEIKFKDDKPRFSAVPESFFDFEPTYLIIRERYIFNINSEEPDAKKIEEEIKNRFENLNVKIIPKKIE
jgi:hypothetical protein